VRSRTLGLLAAALMMATACGSGGTSTGGLTTVNVGVIAIVDCAPLYLGIQQHFFQDQGLRLKPQLIQGGAAITAAVLSGNLQVGFSNNVSLIIASSKHLPVRIVAAGVQAGPRPDHDYVELVVPSSSPIHSLADLEGKTVAVNNLDNIGPLSVNAALQKAGVDIAKVRYIEVSFPDMQAALEGHRVDAAWVVEPFLSALESAPGGVRVLSVTPAVVAPYFPISSYFVTLPYLQSHRDLVDRFVRAMNHSLQYAQTHPEAVRAVVPTYTKIPAEVAQRMTLPQWRTDIGASLIRYQAQLARQYGYIRQMPDWKTLLG